MTGIEKAKIQDAKFITEKSDNRFLIFCRRLFCKRGTTAVTIFFDLASLFMLVVTLKVGFDLFRHNRLPLYEEILESKLILCIIAFFLCVGFSAVIRRLQIIIIEFQKQPKSG